MCENKQEILMYELQDQPRVADELLARKIPVNFIATEKKDIHLEMLRLDKIHPEVSGNKLFKLYYFLRAALSEPGKTLLTFGGPFSNHLAAAAYAADMLGINSIGLVPGSSGLPDTPTMQFCKQHGMELKGLGRSEFRQLAEDISAAEKRFPHAIIIPQGGFSKQGAKGAAMIASKFPSEKYSHIALAVGTGATLAGILNSTEGNPAVLAFPALKGMNDITQRMNALEVPTSPKLKVIHDYHFGGFTKINNELIGFMNQFYHRYQIPLDRVYTSKMMFGIMDLIRKDYFPSGSRILCLHTGGLQGNLSLPTGTLDYC